MFRRKDKWLSRHLIFALHCYSFLFSATLLWGLVAHFVLALHPLPLNWRRSLTVDPIGVVMIVYLLFATRRVYRASWVRATLATAALTVVNVLINVGSILGGALFAFALLSRNGV